MKSKRAPAPLPLSPAAAAEADSAQRLQEFEARVQKYLGRVLQREERNEHLHVDTDPTNRTKLHALRLVTNSAEPLNEESEYLTDLRELQASREAIAILETQHARLAVLACAERSLERALQAKDAVERKIGRLVPLPGEHFQLLGRLGRNETVAGRMMAEAVKAGWISKREWEEETTRSAEQA